MKAIENARINTAIMRRYLVVLRLFSDFKKTSPAIIYTLV
jgi:hypothetical protein